jgi:hypothetical protein
MFLSFRTHTMILRNKQSFLIAEEPLKLGFVIKSLSSHNDTNGNTFWLWWLKLYHMHRCRKHA